MAMLSSVVSFIGLVSLRIFTVYPHYFGLQFATTLDAKVCQGIKFVFSDGKFGMETMKFKLLATSVDAGVTMQPTTPYENGYATVWGISNTIIVAKSVVSMMLVLKPMVCTSLLIIIKASWFDTGWVSKKHEDIGQLLHHNLDKLVGYCFNYAHNISFPVVLTMLQSYYFRRNFCPICDTVWLANAQQMVAQHVTTLVMNMKLLLNFLAPSMSNIQPILVVFSGGHHSETYQQVVLEATELLRNIPCSTSLKILGSLLKVCGSLGINVVYDNLGVNVIPERVVKMLLKGASHYATYLNTIIVTVLLYMHVPCGAIVEALKVFNLLQTYVIPLGGACYVTGYNMREIGASRFLLADSLSPTIPLVANLQTLDTSSSMLPALSSQPQRVQDYM